MLCGCLCDSRRAEELLFIRYDPNNTGNVEVAKERVETISFTFSGYINLRERSQENSCFYICIENGALIAVMCFQLSASCLAPLVSVEWSCTSLHSLFSSQTGEESASAGTEAVFGLREQFVPPIPEAWSTLSNALLLKSSCHWLSCLTL